MDRKQFLKTCGIACLGTTALATLLQSCASSNYFAQSALINNRVVIKKSEFIKVEKDRQTHRKYVLLKTGKLSFPVCIFKISDDNYSAVLMECTHNSCELNPQGSYLVCPCHGSEFSNTGIVQNPPAEHNLRVFKTTTDNDNIYVQI